MMTYMAQLSSDTTLTLASGRHMPIMGLGTSQLADSGAAEAAIAAALNLGYRLIDTAKYYGNERSVGAAVREFVASSKTPREEIFVTTKLWHDDFDDPRAAFDASLARLGLEYVDLYLIHWPRPAMPKALWRSLERLYEEGLARSIGVSNFGIAEIDEFLSYANVPPMVNQIKFNPRDHDFALAEHCARNAIVVEAYSPLGRRSLLGESVVERVAKAHGKSAAQVLIRWGLQYRVVPIPKSSSPERLAENLQVFDFALSAEEMAALDALG